ncbi:MAG: transferase [candidate division KSB1 bacterium]|nr:transferase [candidate division KSB1 bacterium]MDZ7273699.1 transferase [candidate division KSB1 bacterium]MDZ7285855.1 transferase [candidate division KSB1 bacterium]MDZ7298887.1 transferase [candidate division KSB1 bacterium]MDZ7309082.1 transferase [candidate division KSB1 bacterium]
MSFSAETYTILPHVQLGSGTVVQPYCLIGLQPAAAGGEALATVIGAHSLLRSHTVIYAGNTIGARFQTGHHVLIRESNLIGDEVSVGSGTVIEHHVQIGNRVRIHSQVFIPEYSILEEECWLGPNVVLTNALHPLCPEVKKCLKGPTIRRGAKIGANAVLLPDIVIGAGALVGAGSVVVASVPDHAVVAGNPARVIKTIAELTCPYDLIAKPY